MASVFFMLASCECLSVGMVGTREWYHGSMLRMRVVFAVGPVGSASLSREPTRPAQLRAEAFVLAVTVGPTPHPPVLALRLQCLP